MKPILKLRYPFALLLILTLASAAFATPGMFDLSFGTNGVVVTDLGTSGDRMEALALDSQGRILAGGDSYNSTTFVNTIAVVRYTSSGVPDSTFSEDGIATVTLDPLTGFMGDIALQTDDKVLVAGSLGYMFAVARLNTDGSPDTTFDIDGIAMPNLGVSSGDAQVVVSLADGKILVAGSGIAGSDAQLILARLNTDGSLDNSFDSDGYNSLPITGGYPGVGEILIQGDGKIILAGSKQSNIGVGQFMLARFNSDGSLDMTFDTDGFVETDISPNHADILRGAAFDAGGKIVAAGLISASSISVDGMVVARYNSDGTLDNTFAGDGVQLTSFSPTGSGFASDVVIDANGKIIVVGSDAEFYYSGQLALARYNTDGTLDTAFDADGTLVTGGISGGEEGQAIVLDSDGRLVVAGFGGGNAVLYRFENDGTAAIETVSNGGFEQQGVTKKQAAGWNGVNLLSDKRVCNTDTKFFAYNSLCAFRFVGSAGNVSTLTHRLTLTGLVPGDDLVLRFMATGKGVIANKADIQVKIKYVSGTPDVVKLTLPAGDLSYDVFQSLPLNINGAVTKATVRLRYRGASGTVTFDNVSVIGMPGYNPPGGALPLPLPAAP